MSTLASAAATRLYRHALAASSVHWVSEVSFALRRAL
jgi:hypothetical protein